MTGATTGVDATTALGSDEARRDFVVDHRYLPPPPLELPPIAPRLLRTKRGLAVTLAAVLLAGGIGSFFAVRAATQGQPGISLKDLTGRYRAAAAALDTSITTFKSAVSNDAQTGDSSQLYTDITAFSADLLSFDNVVRVLNFPVRMQHDANAVLAADLTLRTDLNGTSQLAGVPAQTLQDDYAATAQAHDALNGDLGLAPSAFGSSNSLTA